MTEFFSNNRLWIQTRDELVRSIKQLGFPAELGEAIAKHLGSPKAMERMISYLNYVKPKTEELVVDEMLAIRSEIDAWKEKKAIKEANARYNEMLLFGLTDDSQLPEIETVYRAEEEKAGAKLAVELEALANFFSAEEYHQKYLEKNPGGYCHTPKAMFDLQKSDAGRKDES